MVEGTSNYSLLSSARPKPWERGGGGEDDNDGEDEDDDDDEAEKEAVVVPPRRQPGQRTPPTCHLTITSYSAGRNFVVSSSCLAPKSWKMGVVVLIQL